MSTSVTTIHAGKVLIGDEFVEKNNQVIEINNGKIDKIREIKKGEKPTYSFPESTLSPGFIDTHVHLFSDSSANFGADKTDSDHMIQIFSNMDEFLSAGVTTVRDLGSPGTLVAATRDAVNRRQVIGPRILTSNRVITITGGHGYQIGIECDSESDLRTAVRQLVKEGADCIKIMASGGFVHAGRYEGESLYQPLFSLEQMKVIVNEAHKFGLHVAAHCQNRDAIEMALDSGVDTIEHLTFTAKPLAMVDVNLVKRIVDAGKYVVPTVNNYWLTVGVPWAEKDLALANLRLLYDLGLKMIAGTDAGIPTTTPNLYAQGLKVFDAIGIDKKYILRSATLWAADAIKLGDTVGQIKEGFSADLVALRLNPLETTEAYFSPQAVFRDGVLVAGHRQF